MEDCYHLIKINNLIIQSILKVSSDMQIVNDTVLHTVFPYKTNTQHLCQICKSHSILGSIFLFSLDVHVGRLSFQTFLNVSAWKAKKASIDKRLQGTYI